MSTWLPRTSAGRPVLSGGEPIWLLSGTDVELRKLAGEWLAIRAGAQVVGRGPLRRLSQQFAGHRKPSQSPAQLRAKKRPTERLLVRPASGFIFIMFPLTECLVMWPKLFSIFGLFRIFRVSV